MKDKHTLIGLDLLRALANEGFKIFSLDNARKYASKVGIKPSYLIEALVHLTKQGWINRLKRGLYAFSPTSGFSLPPP